ncbi:class I SAM-dependent methyltransferase [Amycolatopsis acidiphila]|uniref:Class I SAM-dependent methyltransferase n=1 Tax=Amycolatopsis acidiphila TaxID=715473 RepID=A0A558A803_9PSEU|nr:class I SAM-dependent methyltransferase [Amycolatopsis acidiphila]TVT20387.1 class I SAM-dependent methyltransferase [Amycolatopsis acidiphila]UIJ59181.1 class I SAM-dependent methyltransferase [Amycolatopsis acidiphila]GHG78975.1 methyltransferase type 12 [Amycolatopsis acidiphila]
MSPFDTALLAHTCVLELANGERIELPARRWAADPGRGDELMLARCTGPTLDIGCGPGRLTSELTARGVSSLGIDVSRTAVRLTRTRGGSALRRDVFDRVPGEGRWQHALLADGNIGIGGDPVRLLRRVRELLAPDGRVLIEVEPGRQFRRGHVRVGNSSWFPWAWLGVDALDDIAHTASLEVAWTGSHGSRHFTELAVE